MTDAQQNVKQGWHWSPLIGVMYGKIPVGLIIAGAIIVVLIATGNL